MVHLNPVNKGLEYKYSSCLLDVIYEKYRAIIQNNVTVNWTLRNNFSEILIKI